MKALVWHGAKDIRCDEVPDPKIEHPRDAIVRMTSCALCGSDLHIYDGYIPGMKSGDILGHEFMGEVVETGSASTLEKGQRIVVPFPIACGRCYHCSKQQYSGCENGNPADKQDLGREMYGQPTAAIFGYSHLTGGYAGGQAEYVRVPFSDFGPLVIPDDSVEDDKVLFLTDILPTGWMAAENDWYYEAHHVGRIQEVWAVRAVRHLHTKAHIAGEPGLISEEVKWTLSR